MPLRFLQLALLLAYGTWAATTPSLHTREWTANGIAEVDVLGTSITQDFLAIHLEPRGLSSNSSSVKSTTTAGQIFALQVTCCVIAGISLVAAAVISYWFFQMRKVFRHRLIFILMLSDVHRSIWFFIFPLVSFTHGPIQSTSKFCQASGFFTQYSFSMNDFAVLALAIHTALQIFRPQPLDHGQGGLYRVRRWVYAALVIIPVIASSLAFINEPIAFANQGPICITPVRPIWYRLALTWIPRYLVLATIIGLYIAIYVHAEREFKDSKKFRRARQTNELTLWNTSGTGASAEGEKLKDRISRIFHSFCERATPILKLSLPFTDMERKWSEGSTLVRSRSSRVQSKDFAAGSRVPGEQSIGSAHTDMTLYMSAYAPDVRRDTRGSRVESPTRKVSNVRRERTFSRDVRRSGMDPMRNKRRIIRRQLRLLFVYPVIYFVMWLPAFALHCTSYSDDLIAHPVYGLVVVAYVFIITMTLADFAIFSVRERPWRHVPGSDGTVLGSFAFWRHGKHHPAVQRPSSASDYYYAYGSSNSADGHSELTPPQETSHRMSRSSIRFPSDGPNEELRGEPGRPSQEQSVQRGPDRRPHETVLEHIDSMMTWEFEEDAQNSAMPSRPSRVAEPRKGEGLES